MNVESYLTDTVYKANGATRNDAGDLVFDAQVSFKARVEHSTKLIRNAEGKELQAEHVFATTTPVDSNDRIWLPDDDQTDNNAARRILKIKRATTKDGTTTLYEAFL